MKITLILATAAIITSGAAIAEKAGTKRADAIAAVERKFKQMDADGSGGVSQAELNAFMAKVAERKGDTLDPAKALRRMKSVDANADGQLSLDELKTEESTKFDKADANKNGKIDDDEAS